MTVIPHWLEKRAFLTPHRTAIQLIDRTKITFQQLREDAICFASQLYRLGIRKGEHISLLSKNSYEMVVAIHALSYLQAKVILLNTRLTPSELRFQYEDSESTSIIYQDKLAEKVKEILPLTKDKYFSFGTVRKQTPENFELPIEMDLDDVFTIMYTSGTTGFPKGVQQTYGNHFWSATSSALNLGLHEEDRWLAALPLFHVSGLSILVKSVIYGMPVHLHTGFSLEDVQRELMNEGITIMSVVSVTLESLVRDLGNERYPSSLRCMLLGGGPAPQSLLEACKEKGIPVFQSYGMTETSSQIVTLSAEDALTKLGSAGKALFPAQLKIIKDKKQANVDEVGEIVVKGPMVTKGYYKRPDANASTFEDGWLHTGDLGYVDRDGYLYVLDRRKDLIISGGENVYPAEIESALKGMEGVLDAGVVGVKDERWGQAPVAFIVTNDKARVTEVFLQEYLTKHLARYKLPKAYYFVDSLPRNAAKKLLRRTLMDWVEKGNRRED
ncbi:o-succinylbenzoate--CoA ligase [Salirhabdus sp. Marseille-P4669]|uniref:o-succinylbenzoate--CoA ligase n=1 Tax=Salirhabdus sp. Marseille-P4669 TaxID=2042310 RepID=UPI000C79A198|nr:o-succinylbenzoate--CoA ligase [Salirhabdus sp. Marseille-P4669]